MSTKFPWKAAGAALRAWRTHAARTIADAAGWTGVSYPLWSRWEHGRKRPSLENAAKVEKLSHGAVAIEAWGYNRSTIDSMHDVMNHREVAS